jgi:hypothetical protein
MEVADVFIFFHLPSVFKESEVDNGRGPRGVRINVFFRRKCILGRIYDERFPDRQRTVGAVPPTEII